MSEELDGAVERFNFVVDSVEARCMAVDGPVTPTLQEISEAELADLWRCAQTIRALSTRSTPEDDFLLQPNPEFSAWVATMPDKWWVRHDLSAARIGWEAAIAISTRSTPTGEVAIKPEPLPEQIATLRHLADIIGPRNYADMRLYLLQAIDRFAEALPPASGGVTSLTADSVFSDMLHGRIPTPSAAQRGRRGTAQVLELG